MNPLKRLAVNLLRAPISFLRSADFFAGRLIGRFEGRIRGEAIEKLVSVQVTAQHDGVSMQFLAPNALCVYRARSFSAKEPETLKWIDGFKEPRVMWDIGANVGLYSVYAAKRHPGLKVFSFEPSFLNIELLARNVYVNHLSDRIAIIPLPLFENTAEDTFILQGLDRGGALSAFSVDYGYDNLPLDPKLKYRTFGFSIDEIVEKLNVPVPDVIKIDVDGVEHLILKGGSRVLSDSRVRSILIELNQGFVEQYRTATALLEEYGFVMLDEVFGSEPQGMPGARVVNTIWNRT